MLTTREAIAVAILAYYVPGLFISLFVSVRQSLLKQMGFFYLVIFCIIRIAGAILEIMSQKHPSNKTDAEWAAILTSIGLSPLFLATNGLLKRVYVQPPPPSSIPPSCITYLRPYENNRIDLSHNSTLRIRILQFVQIPCYLALILAIVGGTRLSSTDPSRQDSAHTYMKVAGILFLLVFIIIVVMAAGTAPHFRAIPDGSETRIFVAILLAIPFLAVRLLYTLLCDFKDDATFNILDGNAFVQLGMSIIMEAVVTGTFVVVGLLAPKWSFYADQQAMRGRDGLKDEVGLVPQGLPPAPPQQQMGNGNGNGYPAGRMQGV